MSHLHDKPPKNPLIPRTLIPEQYHIKEPVLAPELESSEDIVFDSCYTIVALFLLTLIAEDKIWKTTVFPSLKPASRKEVLLLDKWLTQMLEDNKNKSLTPIGT